jgi:hypothetical protein
MSATQSWFEVPLVGDAPRVLPLRLHVRIEQPGEVPPGCDDGLRGLYGFLRGLPRLAAFLVREFATGYPVLPNPRRLRGGQPVPVLPPDFLSVLSPVLRPIDNVVDPLLVLALREVGLGDEVDDTGVGVHPLLVLLIRLVVPDDLPEVRPP